MPTTAALIVAAGTGERLGGGVPKQYRPISGKPVVRWAAGVGPTISTMGYSRMKRPPSQSEMALRRGSRRRP